MNNTTYIQEMTDDELLEHIRDFAGKPKHQQDLFDYDLHVAELAERSKRGRFITKADILRALNNCDLSFDQVPEQLYVLDPDKFLQELGLDDV